MPDISTAGYNALPAGSRSGFRYDQARGVYTNDPQPGVDNSPMQNGYDPRTNTFGVRPAPGGGQPNTGMQNVAPPPPPYVTAPQAPTARPANTGYQGTGYTYEQLHPQTLPPPSTQEQGPPPVNTLPLEQAVANPTPVTYNAPPPAAPVAPIALPTHAQADPAAVKAATDAAYASSKDKIGLQGRASLTALRDEMGSRGISASGLEGKKTAELIGGMQGELGQVTRDEAGANLARENAVSDQVYGTGVNAATSNANIAAGQRSGDQAAALTNAGRAMDVTNTNNANRRASLQTLAQLRVGGAY